MLLGFGRVGRALAELMAETPKGHPVRIVGLLDRSGYVFDARGLSQARLRAAGPGQGRRRDAGGHGRRARPAPPTRWRSCRSHAVSRPVLVDVTSEETARLLLAALGRGFDLVLANKKPLAGPLGELYAGC